MSRDTVRDLQWQERLGESTFPYLDDGASLPPLVAKAPGHAHATPEQRIAVTLTLRALHLFDSQGTALTRRVPDQDLLLPVAA
ncbi:hypothetical protein FSB08_30105 [Paraburkholderia sp. JPY432]|uniref:hypothetical protein n=1 Tax=Paraburkholderia TaxID=1822464 RepID=UPI0015954859|nr:hypothetical protein [Paraburkholderia youngii]NVH76674.1 hypothetical protein [Paraburkholderia youngii]